jgi:hypothetical protein
MASYRAKSKIFNRFMPKAMRQLPEWETAIEWLMLVGEHSPIRRRH